MLPTLVWKRALRERGRKQLKRRWQSDERKRTRERKRSNVREDAHGMMMCVERMRMDEVGGCTTYRGARATDKGKGNAYIAFGCGHPGYDFIRFYVICLIRSQKSFVTILFLSLFRCWIGGGSGCGSGSCAVQRQLGDVARRKWVRCCSSWSRSSERRRGHTRRTSGRRSKARQLASFFSLVPSRCR